MSRKSPAITGKKLNHLSHSQIKTAQCLRRYEHLVVKKDLAYDYAPFIVGRAIHQVIHDYSVYCRDNGIQGGDFEALRDCMKRAVHDHELTPEQEVELRTMCLNFAESEIDFENLIGAEYPFDIVIDQDKDNRPIRFKGVIDRVDARVIGGKPILTIIDYKSQRNVYSAQDVEDDLQFKLYRYAALYHEWRHYNRVQCGLNHLRYGFTRWAEVVEKDELYTEFDSLEHYIKIYWERISKALETGNFPPMRGEWCWNWDGCPVLLAGACPAWSQEEIDRQDSIIERSVRNTRIRGFELKKARKVLQDYFRDREPRNVDGELVGYQIKKTKRYPADVVIEWAKRNGVADFLKSTMTQSEVEKFLKRATKASVIDDLAIEELHASAYDEINKQFRV